MSAPCRVAGSLLLSAALALAGCGGGGDPEPSDPAPAADSAEVWAVGDASDGGPGPRRVAELIARARPERVLFLGDVYDRTAAQEAADAPVRATQDGREDLGFAHFEADFRALLPITRAVQGNHDGGGFYRFWGEQGREVKGYERTRIAGWDLIGLNSEGEVDVGSEQHDWLLEQLEAPGTCRLAYWHTPRHSAGKYADTEDDLEPLWSALSGRAALVVSAHDHNMQRLRPVAGLVPFVSGAGGHSQYDLDEDDPDLVFGEDERDGALRLELSPGRARYAFVSVDGEVLDRGEIPCRTR